MANLLTRSCEAKLAEMMLEWPRFPLEAEALAAPDLKTALRTLICRVDDRNPTIDIKTADIDGALVVWIGINPDLGAFRALYEQLVLTWLFLVVRSFLGMSKGGWDLLAQVTIGRVHSDPAIDALLPTIPTAADGAAKFVIPSEALRSAVPDFKPELWASVLAALDAVARPEQAHKLNEVPAIAELVGCSLRNQGLVLPFAEIARSLDRSQRTLARTLAEDGTTFRAIVDEVRMNMAKDMLARSDASVRQISARLGYSDDTAFVRAFRRCFGMPPARWRNEVAR
jgi:AraC-like DNA-binding protein